MKLKLALATAAFLVISAGVANAAPVVITFDDVSANGYTYDPVGVSGATFANNSGIQANGSAWGFTAAPSGTQTAFLQTNENQQPGGGGAITITAAGLTSGQLYDLSFFLEGRPNYSTPLPVSVTGFGSYTAASNSVWTKVDAGTFTASGTSQSFTFSVPTVTGVDASTGLDSVSISAAPEPGVWALMIAGLAMMGGALRLRRRQTGAVAAA